MSQRRIKESRKKTLVLQENMVNVWDDYINIWKNGKSFILILFFLIFGVYFNSLAGGFVSDDYASITQNQLIGNFGFMFNRANSMSLGTYFVYKLFGYGSPVPYHIFSLIHFFIFCVLAYILVELIFKNVWLSRMSILLFAVHPIHAEAVSWISGRIYLVLAIYIILGLIAFVTYVNYNDSRWLWVSLLSFGLGFLTDKPRPFSLFLLAGLYLLYFGVSKVKFNWLKLVGILGVLGLVFVVLAWPYIQTRIAIVNGGYNATESIFYDPFFQYPTGITKYLQLLWFPIDLTLYHTMYVIPIWLNWLVLILYLASIIYFYFKNKPYFWAMTFLLAAVLPSIMPVKVSWLVAERYMFLGSFGFCVLLSLLILDMSRYLKFVPFTFFGCLMVFYSVRLILRNTDWQTNHNLWVNTCFVSPNSHNAWNNIGDDYDKLKDYVNAVKGFSQSTLVKPNYADAYHNRANIFYKLGRLDLARESYNIAITLSPTLVQSFVSLTQIDMVEKRYDLALQHAEAAFKLDNSNPQTAYILGVVNLESGKKKEATTIFENILKTYPDFKLAKEALLSIGN